MIQEPLHIAAFSISPFGVMLVFAFLGSFLQLRWGMRQLEIGDEEDASALIFAAGVGGIVGAKIYYAVLNRDWHLLFDRSGLVWYGGFVVGAAAVLFTIRRRRLPGWPLADAAVPALALGYAIGRIGCFLVGDDYGRPTSLPWGVAWQPLPEGIFWKVLWQARPHGGSFPIVPGGLPPTTAGELRQMFGLSIPASIPDGQLLPVHPTQLYETLSCLAIWGIGLWLFRRRQPAGRTALIVLGLLAVERFLVEILRAKDDRFFGPLTLAQVISIAVLVLVTALLVWRSRRPAAGPA